MSYKKGKVKKKTFKKAVEETPDVKAAYEVGLAALGGYRNKVELGDARKCEGSVDIDVATTIMYPNANRWDYAFSYKGEAFFIEVHSADTGEVSTVIRKLQWLKGWLLQQAPEINKLKANSRTPYYWIQSNGYHIEKYSKQERIVAQAGLKPISKLQLK